MHRHADQRKDRSTFQDTKQCFNTVKFHIFPLYLGRYTIKLFLTESSIHMGNICTEVQQGGHFDDFHFPWLFPDLGEISLTSWYGILVETEIIRLNLRNGKHLRRDKLFKFPDFSLTSSFFSSNSLTFPWLFARFHFPWYFPDFQDSGHSVQGAWISLWSVCVRSTRLERQNKYSRQSFGHCARLIRACYCLTKMSIRAKRSISRVFSLFIVPSPFLYIARTKAVLTGLNAYELG